MNKQDKAALYDLLNLQYDLLGIRFREVKKAIARSIKLIEEPCEEPLTANITCAVGILKTAQAETEKAT